MRVFHRQQQRQKRSDKGRNQQESKTRRSQTPVHSTARSPGVLVILKIGAHYNTADILTKYTRQQKH